MVALGLLIVLVAVPIVEIMVLIEVGGAVGTVPTIGLILLTAVVGTVLIRYQGVAVLATLRRDLEQGRPPLAAVADGAFLLIAGILLLTPGFVTDAIGFALLVPGLRRLITRLVVARIAAATRTHRADRARRNGDGGLAAASAGPVIDGTAVEVESPWQEPGNGLPDDEAGRG